MITGSFSLALCTVVFRRFVDSVTGRIVSVPLVKLCRSYIFIFQPTLPVSNSPNTTALLVFSGALYYLYKHLRRGTIVSIGQAHSSPNSRSSRHENKSWFLKNMWGKRKNCTEAICRLAKQSFDSVTSMNPCLLLPKRSFRISFPENATASRENISDERPQNSCNLIYNNEVFQKDSDNDLKLLKDIIRKGSDSVTKHVSAVDKKRVKRLKSKKSIKEKKIVDLTVTSHSSKFQGEKGRRTRSGKVYNLLI